MLEHLRSSRKVKVHSIDLKYFDLGTRQRLFCINDRSWTERLVSTEPQEESSYYPHYEKKLLPIQQKSHRQGSLLSAATKMVGRMQKQWWSAECWAQLNDIIPEEQSDFNPNAAL